MATSTPDLTDLRLERPAPGVARLVLDNPSQRNAMSDAMTESWGRAIDAIAADKEVRVVVVTGEGSAFCSGGNPAWIAGEPDAEVDYLRTRMIAFYRAWLAIRNLEIPTIAALNGHAVGAGLCLALACDIRYAAAGARLSVPFVKLGMNPGMAATYSLPNVVGAAAARELLLTGRAVEGEEALRIGLVSQVFEPDEFADRVQEIAEGIAGTAPIASRYTKLALREDGHDGFEAAIQWEALAQPITLATADLQEGVQAARQKRTADFRGV
jgi:enoyl-CoA hydratase/carnithine racemase